jgi:hypothetical protein
MTHCTLQHVNTNLLWQCVSASNLNIPQDKCQIWSGTGQLKNHRKMKLFSYQMLMDKIKYVLTYLLQQFLWWCSMNEARDVHIDKCCHQILTVKPIHYTTMTRNHIPKILWYSTVVFMYFLITETFILLLNLITTQGNVCITISSPVTVSDFYSWFSRVKLTFYSGRYQAETHIK